MRSRLPGFGLLIALLVGLGLPCLVTAHSDCGSGHLQGTWSDEEGLEEADVDLGLLDVITDAPWRVEVRGGSNVATLPVLYYFPEKRQHWRQIQVERFALFIEDGPARIPLYEDTREAPPRLQTDPVRGIGGSGTLAVDAWGRVSDDLDLVRDVTQPPSSFAVPLIEDATRGWHVILRLPVHPSALRANEYPVVLTTEVSYRRLDEGDDTVYTVKRRLHVSLDSQPMPRFPGWVPYDTHVHTIAEYSGDLSTKAIRKAYGGPVQMFKECAHAIGLIDNMGQFKDRVITTDHNTFFSDREYVRHGPTTVGISPEDTQITRPDLNHYFVGPRDEHVKEGQREFENYLDLYGITFGQELTLAKRNKVFNWITGTLGSHLLAYSTRHFMGPFHGGGFFVFRDEDNPNTLDHVLTAIAADPAFPHGFCFAAHPFADSAIARNLLTQWTGDQIKAAILGEYIRYDDQGEKEFVFKGFELWNEKKSRQFHTSIVLPERLRQLKEDPTGEPLWKQGDPGWDDGLQYGLHQYHQAVIDSMSYSTKRAPKVRFIRKFYLAAGTDAHGDFNRDNAVIARGLRTLPALISRFLKAFSVSDNAFGLVRTVVDPSAASVENGMGEHGMTPQSRALWALGHGQGVITDGPVIDVSLDADARFDARSLTWHKDSVFEDMDGRMGGGGRVDGLRTALVPVNGRRSLLRYRWTNTAPFGGPLESLEVYLDEAGGQAKVVQRDRPGGKAWVLEPRAALDPARPPDPSGFSVVPLNDVLGTGTPRIPGPLRTMSALSVGGFTKRTPEPPFDYRCYTNPIWMAPVKVGLVGSHEGERIPPAALKVTYTLPFSMKDEPVVTFLEVLDSDGKSSGERYSLVPDSGGSIDVWRDSAREEIQDNVMVVTNSTFVPLTLPPGSAGYVLVLVKPRDAHGNTLNSLAWPLVPSPGGATPAPLRPAPESP